MGMDPGSVPVPLPGGTTFGVIDIGCCKGPACGLAKNDSGEARHQQRGGVFSVLFKPCIRPLGKLRSSAAALLTRPTLPLEIGVWG